MQEILDVIIAIGDGIKTAIDFLVSFIQDIAYVVQLTGKFVLSIPSYFTWLPVEAVAVIVSIFAVVVIYKVMGREG